MCIWWRLAALHLDFQIIYLYISEDFPRPVIQVEFEANIPGVISEYP
jgi:hypothetical protein